MGQDLEGIAESSEGNIGVGDDSNASAPAPLPVTSKPDLDQLANTVLLGVGIGSANAYAEFIKTVILGRYEDPSLYAERLEWFGRESRGYRSLGPRFVSDFFGQPSILRVEADAAYSMIADGDIIKQFDPLPWKQATPLCLVRSDKVYEALQKLASTGKIPMAEGVSYYELNRIFLKLHILIEDPVAEIIRQALGETGQARRYGTRAAVEQLQAELTGYHVVNPEILKQKSGYLGNEQQLLAFLEGHKESLGIKTLSLPNGTLYLVKDSMLNSIPYTVSSMISLSKS